MMIAPPGIYNTAALADALNVKQMIIALEKEKNASLANVVFQVTAT
jgi:hypothetical protein